MNRLREKKNTYLNLLKVFHRQGKLTDKEAQGFEGMFRRCSSQEEQKQVFEALMNNLTALSHGTDRYALLHRDDLLDDD